MNHAAIYATHPAVKSITDGPDGSVTCHDADGKVVEIDRAAYQVEATRLQAEYEATQYQRDRVRAYPSFVDQLDLLYHGGYDVWKASIKAVKDKYPKGQAKVAAREKN